MPVVHGKPVSVDGNTDEPVGCTMGPTVWIDEKGPNTGDCVRGPGEAKLVKEDDIGTPTIQFPMRVWRSCW